VRVLVSADMEGATGVTCPDDVTPGSPAWSYHRALFTEDVNAAVRGFVAAGATDVIVNDAHDSMRNLLLDRVDDRARLLIGRHKALGMMEGIRGVPGAGPVDAVAFVGYHTGAGMPGVLSHTYLGNTITGVWLDGEPAGEGRLNAALAAEHGVPVVLVTGDDLTIEDAAGYAPHAAGVAVKTCIDRYSAICLPPARSAELIAKGAEDGLRARRELRASVTPHELVVEFDATHPVVAVCAVPGVEQIDVRRVRFSADTMTGAMRCFKAVTTLTAASREHTYG
jgi:D-amino peptidase